MSRLRVHNFAISLDGFGAGRSQDLDSPLGVGGLALHDWIVPTRTFQQMMGADGGEKGVDDGSWRVHGRMTAYTSQAVDCRACGKCVAACPEKAIRLMALAIMSMREK